MATGPLKGTVDGKDFTAVEAMVEAPFASTDTTRFINIYPSHVGCDSSAAHPPISILISVPWTAGYTKDFSFGLSDDSQTATFVIDKGGTPDNIVAVEGRVELITLAADAMTPGKMRLRAIAGADEVEGEIALTACATSP